MNIDCTIQVAEIKQVTEKDVTEPTKLEETKYFETENRKLSLFISLLECKFSDH